MEKVKKYTKTKQTNTNNTNNTKNMLSVNEHFLFIVFIFVQLKPQQ